MLEVHRTDRELPPLALEMVGDEGEDGVIAGLGVGLVADHDNGEVFFLGASQATADHRVLLPHD